MISYWTSYNQLNIILNYLAQTQQIQLNSNANTSAASAVATPTSLATSAVGVDTKDIMYRDEEYKIIKKLPKRFP